MKKIFKFLTIASCVFLSIASLMMVGRGDFITGNDSSEVTKIPINTTQDIPVCYNDATKVKYTSIEKALEIAKNNSSADTIYVLPGTNPVISRDCEISTEDTLCFPFLDDPTTGVRDYGEDRKNELNHSFADKDAASISKFRKNYVIIRDNVVLTNNGTLLIGGKNGTGERGGQLPVCHTGGDYVELNMGTSSKIENFGTMKVHGYIKEAKKNNGSKVINYNGSSMYIPFVIYDYRGGGYSSRAVRNDISPFNLFDFPNCQPLNIFRSGSKMYGMVSIYARMWAVTDVIVIGSNNDNKALFKISDGSVSMKYNAANNLYTTYDVNTNSTKEQLNITEIHTSGDISLSSIAIDLGVSIDTSKFLCPISYKFHIFIDDGTFHLQNKMKFLNGSYVELKPGSVVNINSEIIFYQDFIPKIITARETYPSFLIDYPAKLINNGTLNINGSFGGVVETTTIDSSASLIIGDKFTEKVLSYDILEGYTNPSTPSVFEHYIERAKGYLSDKESQPLGVSILKKGMTLKSKNKHRDYPASGEIDYAHFKPESNESARYASRTYQIEVFLSPYEHTCTDIVYTRNAPKGTTLVVDPNDNSKATFTTPAQASWKLWNEKYTLECIVTYKKEDGSQGQKTVKGTYIAKGTLA